MTKDFNAKTCKSADLLEITALGDKQRTYQCIVSGCPKRKDCDDLVVKEFKPLQYPIKEIKL